MPLISYDWHINLDAIMQEKRNSIALLTYFLHWPIDVIDSAYPLDIMEILVNMPYLD